MYKRVLAAALALVLTFTGVPLPENVSAAQAAGETVVESTEYAGSTEYEDSMEYAYSTEDVNSSKEAGHIDSTEDMEAKDTEAADKASRSEISKLPEAPKALEGTEDALKAAGQDLESDLSVKGTNSFGALLTNELSQEMAEQEENNGCNVFSVEVTGTEASVSFETVEDCTLVVGIYDEAGIGMIAAGSLEVYSGETVAVVDIETENMPLYFYLRAFLVESNTLRPLCTSYASPNYTREMQEFFAMTTADFDAERVLNLDDDISNNFAVYSDDTIIIPQSAGENEVVTADDESNRYVIENANESISSLQQGDIFAYEYEEGEVLIVKVDSIVMDGTTATISGAETSMEEIFDYVKIDTEAGVDEAVIDPSVCSEGVSYEGLTDYSDEEEAQVQTYAMVDDEVTFTTALSMKINGFEWKAISVTGGVDLSMGTTLKFYISSSYQYMELKLEYSTKLNVAITAKKEWPETVEIKLPSVHMNPLPGIILGYNPSIVFEADAKVELSGTIKGTVGLAVDSDTGIKSLNSKPKTTIKLEIEGKVFLGLKFEPKVEAAILNIKLAEAGLSGCIGVEITGKVLEWKDTPDDVIHDCGNACISGDVSAKGEVSIKVKLLKLEFSYEMMSVKYKISDWYLSFAYGEGGWTTCPHLRYKTAVTVIDQVGNPVEGMRVEAAFAVNGNAGPANAEFIVTDATGKAEGYLTAGGHTLTVAKDGVCYATKKITVKDQAKEVVVQLRGTTGGVAGGGSGGGSICPITPVEPGNAGDAGKVKRVSLGGAHSGVVMEDGSLYMWGDNEYGQLGTGTKIDSSVPVKVLDNVISVSLGGNHSGAITKGGSLYMWGDNEYGQLGTGTKRDSSVPVKVLDNVISVSLGGNHSGAITEDGSLYMWGENYSGGLGNGTKRDSSVPIKVLDNVVSISLGGDGYSGAITTDRSLYMWGDNWAGQLGNGTTTDSSVPIKVLDNAVAVSLGATYSGAITTDGSLYVWGDNISGVGIGDGKSYGSDVPIKIMDNVVFTAQNWSHGAITEDKTLYMWGHNYSGELGNGTTIHSNIPVKIMDNVEFISLGEDHSGAITTDGSLYMWGSNRYGQLGNGTTTDSLVPIPIQIPPVATASVSEEASYSMYALEEESILRLGAATVRDVAGTEQKTATFRNLVPNDTYNFYVTKSLNAESLLSPDNLLYISQAVADSSGGLEMTYQQREGYEDAAVFVIGSSKRDLSNASLTVSDVNYTGSGQIVLPTVSYQGSTLVLDRDYELTEGFRVAEPGTYTLKISGIGVYVGALAATYRVVCSHSYTAQVTKQPTVEAAGEKTYTCTICGHSYTKEMEKLPQNSTENAKPNGGSGVGANGNSNGGSNAGTEANVIKIIGQEGNTSQTAAPGTDDSTDLPIGLAFAFCGMGVLFCLYGKRRKENHI